MTHDTSRTRHPKFEISPEDVWSLSTSHPAIIEARTLFPSTVANYNEGNSIFVSGHNNPKIGRQVEKGSWAGMPIFTLTLEERATCPRSCHVYRSCYGNAMRWARRLRHGEEFEVAMSAEVDDLAVAHPQGFVVRLHVLGDFYSRSYVYLWTELLRRHENLHVFGYTARLASCADEDDRDIAIAISAMNAEFEDRCFIRFSAADPAPGGTTVITRVPQSAVVPEGLVCPAETDATACCATCGLCWAKPTRQQTIVFVKHGAGSSSARAEIRAVSRIESGSVRPIRPLKIKDDIQKAVGRIVDIRHVPPSSLYVDERYQRTPSRKSAELITRIATNWNWRKFTPPRVTEDADGSLHIIDGQHTAIAAASRPDIENIPVIVIDASTLESRADTFIGINRDRISVTPSQIFYAEVAAGNPEAVGVKKMCEDADIIILRSPPPSREFGPGETMAIGTLRRLLRDHGFATGHRVLTILSESGMAPISEWAILGVTKLLTDKSFSGQVSDDRIYQILRKAGADIVSEPYRRRAADGVSLGDALASYVLECAR